MLRTVPHLDSRVNRANLLRNKHFQSIVDRGTSTAERGRPMKHRRESQFGYSAAELVIVVAIVGLFTMAAIPNFVQMVRQNQLRTGARTFASDIRYVRMLAISSQRPTKISFAANSANYEMHQLSSANVWTATRPKGQTNRELKLPAGITVLSHTFVDIAAGNATATVPADADAVPDLVYLPNGTAWQLADSDEKIVLRTQYQTALRNFEIEIRPAGNLKTRNY